MTNDRRRKVYTDSGYVGLLRAIADLLESTEDYGLQTVPTYPDVMRALRGRVNPNVVQRVLEAIR